jgi:hypothetical protein
MPNVSRFELEYRPASYWGPRPLAKHAGSTVKGELRRRSAIDKAQQALADAEDLKGSLTEKERAVFTSVHPWLMGGEYLPDALTNEVEIARIVMRSVMMDVVSIRARRTKHRIVYSIVDEYTDEEREYIYKVSPKTSIRPLRLRQLIAMIDGAAKNGLVGHARAVHHEHGSAPQDTWDFETAVSTFYPQLAAWYDECNAEWLKTALKDWGEDEEEDELGA